MKRQIRTNVFETNSSSQHSLCVMKKDEHYTSEEILKDFYLWDDRNEKVSSGISYNMTNGEYEVALETCNGKIVEK